MNRRHVLAGAAAAITAGLAGCSSGDTDNGEVANNETGIDLSDGSPGARSDQSLRLVVGEEIAGAQLESVGATYPREHFTVQSAQHEEIFLGVDTTGDGTADEEFGADAISGVNNNDFSFTVEVDSDYTFAENDAVMLEYPAVDNPDESGEYEVELTVNETQIGTATVTIG